MKALVVEDEKKTANFIRKALEGERFEVETVFSGDSALPLALERAFDVIVLDIMLPGKDGLSVLRGLREQGNSTPVLLLSARSHVNERVAGLKAGADDYLPKPFALEELTARVQVLVRRGGEAKSILLRVGDLALDTISRTATRNSRRVELAGREYRLLEFLMRNEGKVCSRALLLQKVWDYDFDPGTNLVDVTIRRLRDKLEHPSELPLLHTVRGVGYQMRAPIHN
ncbi:MAG: response regulator transcription factor [Verrucomicrobiales bacterium]|nr:response regulator transcription factor [Verrucomicrobiales bacterium]